MGKIKRSTWKEKLETLEDLDNSEMGVKACD
jgi:hypothetical protein